jgi:IS5 family transposase
LIRGAVESLPGTMKRSYRLARMRAFTRLRNTIDLALFCLAFNLRRWWRLTTLKCAGATSQRPEAGN